MMGYTYEVVYGRTGRLCCDSCGTAGGVRKRSCPHKVLTDSHRSPRQLLPYCSPPALCASCFVKHGRGVGIHERCAEGARESQAEYDATEVGLEQGRLSVTTAWGSWFDGVPQGWTLVAFAGRSGQRKVLVPADEYDPSQRPWLDQYPTATEWTGA